MDFLGPIIAAYTTYLIISLISVTVMTVLGIIAKWKILTKAGYAGWKILIPVYGAHVWANVAWNAGIFWCAVIIPSVLLLIGVFSPFFLLLGFIDLIVMDLVWTIGSSIHLARRFGKSSGFACGLIFLGFIFQLILGFGNSACDYRHNC